MWTQNELQELANDVENFAAAYPLTADSANNLLLGIYDAITDASPATDENYCETCQIPDHNYCGTRNGGVASCPCCQETFAKLTDQL